MKSIFRYKLFYYIQKSITTPKMMVMLGRVYFKPRGGQCVVFTYLRIQNEDAAMNMTIFF